MEYRGTTVGLMSDIRHVHISHDPETGGWWAESDDVPGLVSEAPTQRALIDRVLAVAPELLALNEPGFGEVTLRFLERQAAPRASAGHAKFA